MSPPRTCLRPACHDFKVPWTVPSFSEYFILISSKLFVLNNCVLKCNILVHSSQMIAAQGQEQSSSCSYFKKRNIIAETKNWHAIYCLFISDSCFQLLHADGKFWSHRYFFLHLCTHISGNTGYSEREIFLPDRKKKIHSKSWSQWKDQLNRMQRCVPETIQEVIELTGFLCFLFRSTPTYSYTFMSKYLKGTYIYTLISKYLKVTYIYTLIS